MYFNTTGKRNNIRGTLLAPPSEVNFYGGGGEGFAGNLDFEKPADLVIRIAQFCPY